MVGSEHGAHGAGRAGAAPGGLIRPSYHDLIATQPIVGRAIAASDVTEADGRVVLISHGLAERLYGEAAAAVGESLSLDGEPWTVIGVMPRGALLPGWGLRAVDLWRPLTADAADSPMPALGLLREGVPVDRANERLAEVAAAVGQTSAGHASLVRDQVANGMQGYLGLLGGAVVLLLLIACVNVSNLLLFRAESRKRETAVRSALGGGQGRLARQLLVESVVLALAGGSVGMVLAYGGQAAILRLRPDQLEALDYVSIDAGVFGFAVAVSLVAGVLFGLTPALQAGRPDALAPLRSGVRTSGDVVGRRLRWVLVAGEVAFSFALLMGSLAVLGTLVERQRVDVGFRADEVVVMNIEAPGWRYVEEEDRAALFDRVHDALSRLPGVLHSTRASGAPPRAGVTFGEIEVEGLEPTGETLLLHGPWVGPDYFAALGQSIVRGRAYTEDDMASEEALIILGEETARRLFPDRDPVGARFRASDEEEWTTVIGVAADVPMTGLSTRQRPLQVYHPLRTAGGWSSATFLLRVGSLDDPAPLLPLMREVALSLDPDLRIDQMGVAADLLRHTLERERFATTVMSVFAALALILAAVGLYGVVSQVVGQRTSEIGIRMALGARRAEIAGMVLRRAGGATAVGVLGGVVLALVGTRFLESAVVGVAGGSVSLYLLSAAALALTSLVAAYAPARRATRIDPVEAMRGE